MASKNYSANLKVGATMSSSVGRVFGTVNKRIKEQESTLKKLRSHYKNASKGVGEYAGKLDQLQREIDQTERKLKALRGLANLPFGGVGKAMVGDFKRLGMVAGVAGVAIGGISAAIGKVTIDFLKMADDLADTAESLNISVEALQMWEYAAADVGVAATRLHGGLARLQGGMEQGSKNIQRIFEDLGLNMERVKKLAPEKQLEVIAEAFKDYKGETSKAFMAAQLFGRANVNLVAVLNKGKQGLENYNKEAREAGFLLDDAAMAAAGKADVAYRKLGATMQGLRNQIALQFIPVFTRLVDKFSAFLRDHAPAIRDWAEKFALAIEAKGVPALVMLMDKLPGIIDGFATFARNVYDVVDAMQSAVGGWDNLGMILLAANFAPTILAIGKLVIAVGSLSKALWALAPAWLAGMGPVAWVTAAIGGIGAVLFSIVDPGGPLDILGRMFPETMEKVRRSAQAVGEWMEDKIDSLIAKLKELISWFDKLTGLGVGDFFSGGFGGPASTGKPDYTLPRTNYSGILGVVPKGDRPPIPGLDEKTPAPSATKDDILEHLKPQSNNTYNINVNAPGADGADIAERIRRAFERQPLFDSDGALVPG
jgi:hypothetical protein